MPAANEREDTFNEENRLRWLGGGDQRVRSSLLVCVTKRIKHLAIRGNFQIISGGGGQLKVVRDAFKVENVPSERVSVTLA